MTHSPLHIVILAAGQGTRMKSRLPKVLQPLGGRPLLAHIIEAAAAANPERIHVVYGHGGDEVRRRLADADVNWVLQDEQLGTGHAVKVAMPDVPDGATTLVLTGDVPMVRSETLKSLVAVSGDGGLLTVVLDNPKGLGRILRANDGSVRGIVEEKDANEEQKAICEINTGIMAFPSADLRRWLESLSNDNAQGEYYLTDVIALAVADGKRIEAIASPTEPEVLGVNDKVQLAALERFYQQQQITGCMAAGLTVIDPARVDIRGSLSFGRDVTLDINTVIEGQVVLADGVTIGPNCTLKNCVIGEDTEVLANSVIEGSQVGVQCLIGPFARLRPDSVLDKGAKVGNFVELKKTTVGKGSKVNHLSYVGDAQVGAEVNIGAGVITCNYDGANKHQTVIGDGAFIGSDVQLVAPVEVGDGATIGAGSTITKDAPANELSYSRTKQQTLSGWKRPKKKET